jgi:hypothetical protein
VAVVIDLETLLRDPPMLHGDGTVLFKLSNDVLRFIEQRVNDTCTTLETGAGLSTIIFAMKGARHTAVTPDAAQAQRIQAYCQAHAISTSRVSFQIGRSETVLPQLSPGALDMVLVDGRHGFPSPFIDWYYTAAHLKIGGVLLIDDVPLWTGHELRQFLLGESEWRHEQDFSRSSAFVKLAEGSLDKSWTEQPYVVRQTAAVAPRGGLAGWARHVGRGVSLLRRGEVTAFLNRLRTLRSL